MQFHVAQLLKEPVGATRDYEIAEDIGDVVDHEVSAVSPLVGRIRLIRTNRGLLLEGRLEVTVRLTCVRCLEEYLTPVPLIIREEFLPTIDVKTGLPVSLPKDEDYFTIDENHTLDLTEVVRQYVLMALPMQPLCRVECAGLCPTCGRNLNVVQCRCEPVPADERLAVLGELLRDLQQTETEEEEAEQDRGSGGADSEEER
ncbi:MAG: YceD family protein [Chloroflexota bacterium]